jgi:DNA-binding beta-propeller fold protein YncE
VVDHFNDRVQVFDSAWTYKTTIGETGVAGPGNGDFNGPVSVAVNSSGTVFVADRFNMRVQQCTTSDGFVYTCTVFAGVTGEIGSDSAHLQPSGIALDKNGWLYVADDSNNRVQVFDANGIYRGTIGGSSGANNNQLRNPEGVAVDQGGNVYVTDTYNQRIQKFFPGVFLTYLPVIRR